MESSNLIRRRRNSAFLLMGAGILAGIVYTIFSRDYDKPMAWVNAFLIGSLLGVFVSITEIRVFNEHLRRKMTFFQLLSIRVFVYAFLVLIILLAVLSISRVFWYEMNYADVWTSDEFRTYVFHGNFKVAFFYSFGLVSLVVFTYQIMRILGQGYLVNIITGKYYDPRIQERVFCFLKLNRIAHVARHMKHDKYFDMINDIIYDITEIIVAYNGIIYQYVEDDMVIHWSPEAAMRNGNSIRCFFGIRDKLYQRREFYLNQYDYFPDVLGALHIGEVVHGEIGHDKTEISFYGDVLNTTSRILDRSSTKNNLLLSEKMFQNIELPAIYHAESLGLFNLEGKREPQHIFSVTEKALKTMP